MSWKLLLFSSIAFAISDINSLKIKGSDEAALDVVIANNPALSKKLYGANAHGDEMNDEEHDKETSDPNDTEIPKNPKKKKRIVVKQYVKRCNLKESVLDSPKSADHSDIQDNFKTSEPKDFVVAVPSSSLHNA